MTDLEYLSYECWDCGEVKSAGSFYRVEFDQATAGQKRFQCKECARAWQRAKRAKMTPEQLEAARAKQAALLARHRKNDPTVVERNRMLNRAQGLAAKRLKEAHPKQWRALLEQAKPETGYVAATKWRQETKDSPA